MNNKWLENLKDISKKRRVGKCPFCKGADTDYKCSIVDQENRLGYMDIWCNDCKRAFHVSRMQILEDMKTDGKIPKGLKY